MEIKNEIIIHRPIGEVFTFLGNFENIPKWNYFVASVKKVTDGPIGLDTVFHQQRKVDSQDFVITEFDYPRLIAVETTPRQRHILRRFTLFIEGGYTRIEDYWTIELNWLFSLFSKNKVQAAVKDNLQKLKTLLETGQVTLQDGRTVTLS